MAPLLQVQNVSVSVGSLKLVDDVSFHLDAGDWLMVAGPNGAGKSTLLAALSRGMPYRGRVLVEGRNAAAMPSKAFARALGMLAQQHSVNYEFTVEEVVSMGRYCHRGGLLAPRSDEDAWYVDLALEQTGLTAQRRQSVLTLSGGELQRAFLAQLFAQDPKILLLDEPTNHLDLQYQAQLFELIEQWRRQPGRAVLSVVHDLSLARLYGNKALLMHKSHVIACGDKQSTFTPKTLNSIYQMDVYAWMDKLYSPWNVQ